MDRRSRVEHLFLVTCGLDSAQAGEQEIAAQIRLAWETARGVQVCGPTLDKLLSEALSMANRVHKLEAKRALPVTRRSRRGSDRSPFQRKTGHGGVGGSRR